MWSTPLDPPDGLSCVDEGEIEYLRLVPRVSPETESVMSFLTSVQLFASLLNGALPSSVIVNEVLGVGSAVRTAMSCPKCM